MQGKVNQIVKKSPGKIKREKVNKITFNSVKMFNKYTLCRPKLCRDDI